MLHKEEFIKKDEDVLVCQQCGYRIKQIVDFRCPRCYYPLLQCGTCSGSCRHCANSAPKDVKIHKT